MTQSIRDVQDLKHSLKFSQSNIAELKNSNATHLEAFKLVSNNLANVQMFLDKLVLKSDDLKNYSRRNNLVIDSIPDVKSESWHDTEVKAKKIVADHLKLDPKLIEMERVQAEGRYRSVAMKLLCHKF